MNPRTRRAALYAIGAIAILASANALAHSYAGLYDWAVHHRLSGWQAKSWPAEIDVFLAVGELALYVAYLDGWPARQRIWPWVTALTGLAVSIAGNIGHIQAVPGHPVILADRLTAATSPLAAFAGLSVGTKPRDRPATSHDKAGALARKEATVNEVPEATSIGARLEQAASLPEVLAAGFDAFEAIRITARHHQDQVPALFAAFMTTADAAVDGREAITIAPSLPGPPGARPGRALAADADTGQAADIMAALAAVLRDRLSQAAARAGTAGDRAACQDAADAAGRIRQLMTR